MHSSTADRSLWLFRFALLTSCVTFFLIIAGGLVTSTDSGLAVPDWPLSYGQLMPPMVGGVFYEHGHRMVAAFVGFLTVVLMAWILKGEDRRWVRRMGIVALFAVITQGILGGLTVLFLLPTWISVFHATLAQAFFSLTMVIALVLSPSWREHRPVEHAAARRTRVLAVLASLGVFLQLMLGALMRHTQSGLAIPDFPLSYGGVLPPLDAGALPAINEARIESDLLPTTLEQIWIHFAHRVCALVVTVLVLVSVRHILARHRDSQVREPALLLLACLVTQILLGALTVWSGKAVETTTAHVAAGALLLGTSIIVTVRSFRMYNIPGEARVEAAIADRA